MCGVSSAARQSSISTWPSRRVHLAVDASSFAFQRTYVPPSCSVARSLVHMCSTRVTVAIRDASVRRCHVCRRYSPPPPPPPTSPASLMTTTRVALRSLKRKRVKAYIISRCTYANARDVVVRCLRRTPPEAPPRSRLRARLHTYMYVCIQVVLLPCICWFGRSFCTVLCVLLYICRCMYIHVCLTLSHSTYNSPAGFTLAWHLCRPSN